MSLNPKVEVNSLVKLCPWKLSLSDDAARLISSSQHDRGRVRVNPLSLAQELVVCSAQSLDRSISIVSSTSVCNGGPLDTERGYKAWNGQEDI